MPRVVIVGAGISGLALAFRLQQHIRDCTITILEQGARAGGKIWTHRQDGFEVEAGPNGFLDSKPSTLTLCRDLGLGERLIAASDPATQNRSLFVGDRLRPLPHDLASFVASDVLTWRGKLNLMLERFRRRPAPRRDESVAA